ncbi:arylsulfatase [Sunxiuqinia indica]|uniref:arylsulfatase n=1 Tax=Sunxiuqinia indica TaxID=2692584 RepID=UPI00135A2E60|nr:arylsulfatase [Sunxiuqinia indica]
MKRSICGGLAVLLILWACQTSTKQEGKKEIKPNIVYILADDLGYGDLSCYGQQKFQTPNIDRLASQGMLFTQHYAGCSVCAPSRSSLLTGQDTGHTPIRGNMHVDPEGEAPLSTGSFTLAEMLKQKGYTTGAFGKWGLGFITSEGDPNNQGFDQFYGYNSQTLAHNYYPGHLWNNHERVVLNGNSGDKIGEYSADMIQDSVLKFVERNRNHPFFLYYASTIPHAELLLPKEKMAPFKGKFPPEHPFTGAEFGDEKFRLGAYGSQQEPHAAFAAMVTLFDKQVGELMDKLKELGLDKSTLVIFTSDNGPHIEGGADPDYFDSNGPLKGYKRDLYEGGIREPMIACWPGKISAGSTTDLISAFWDVMPTCAELVGAETPQDIQGISFLPTLLGKDGQKQHDHLYWEFHELDGRQAIRRGNWKYVSYNVLDPQKRTVELYDLSTDIGEKNNVADQHLKIVKEMQELLRTARVPVDTFPFVED